MTRVLFLSMALLLPQAHAADAGKAHAHQGVVAPYPTPPKTISLNAEEEESIRAGKPVMKQIEQGSGGRGAAVFVVDASTDAVWRTIKSYNHYAAWIDGVETCEIYRREGDHIYVRFVLTKLGVDVEYFIDHTVGDDWMTWTLDYSRESDLDDSVGMWRVTPLPDAPGRSKVEYSVDLRTSGWVPGFVRTIIVDQGLKDATSWVKQQAEK